MAEVTPDHGAQNTRFGLVTLGDGNSYRVVKAGFGERGQRLYAAVDAFDGATNLADRFKAATSIVKDALGAYYSDERITKLIADELIGVEHVSQVIGIVLAVAERVEDVKKNSADTTLTPTNGE